MLDRLFDGMFDGMFDWMFDWMFDQRIRRQGSKECSMRILDGNAPRNVWCECLMRTSNKKVR